MYTERKKNTIKSENDIEIYENDIYILIDEYIENLDDPNRLYNNKNLITDMLKYLYKSYVCRLLNNNSLKPGHRYNDINLINNLWDIYTSIIYKYSDNIKPNILQFCLFTNISKEVISNWLNMDRRELTPEYANFVKKIRSECEQALVGGGSVFDIFLLKAQYQYNDNLGAVTREEQKQILSAEQLPMLGFVEPDAIETNENS